MTPELDAESITRLRAAIMRIGRMIDRRIDKHGLTRTELSVLAAVQRLDGAGIGELATFEGLNPTMLSRVVAKLVKAGLVQRLSDPKDRRVVHIVVTPAGKALEDYAREARTRLLGMHLGELSDDEARALSGALPALERLAAELSREPTFDTGMARRGDG